MNNKNQKARYTHLSDDERHHADEVVSMAVTLRANHAEDDA